MVQIIIIFYNQQKELKTYLLQIFLEEIIRHREIYCNQRWELKINPLLIFLEVIVRHKEVKIISYNQRKEHKIIFNNQLEVD